MRNQLRIDFLRSRTGRDWIFFELDGCFRHQVLLRGCGQWYRCGRDRVARPSEQENLDPRPQRNRHRQEDVSKGEPSRRQTGLHSRSSDLTSELQSSVRSDEVVIATEQLVSKGMPSFAGWSDSTAR